MKPVVLAVFVFGQAVALVASGLTALCLSGDLMWWLIWPDGEDDALGEMNVIRAEAGLAAGGRIIKADRADADNDFGWWRNGSFWQSLKEFIDANMRLNARTGRDGISKKLTATRLPLSNGRIAHFCEAFAMQSSGVWADTSEW